MTIKGTFSGNANVKLIMGGNVVREVSTTGEFTDPVIMYGDGVDRIFQVEVENDTSNTVAVEVKIQQLDREYITTGSIRFKTWVAKPTRTMTASASIGTAGTYNAQDNIPDMGVMEFLSSIFKMFNIIAEVDADLNVSTKHYDHFMSEGEVKDVTEYVDVSAVSYTHLTLPTKRIV